MLLVRGYSLFNLPFIVRSNIYRAKEFDEIDARFHLRTQRGHKQPSSYILCYIYLILFIICRLSTPHTIAIYPLTPRDIGCKTWHDTRNHASAISHSSTFLLFKWNFRSNASINARRHTDSPSETIRFHVVQIDPFEIQRNPFSEKVEAKFGGNLVDTALTYLYKTHQQCLLGNYLYRLPSN